MAATPRSTPTATSKAPARTSSAATRAWSPAASSISATPPARRIRSCSRRRSSAAGRSGPRHRPRGRVRFSLRGSLLGIASPDHRLERYFDIGADAGIGLGAAFGLPRHDIEGTASAWYGAWTGARTINAGDGYVALTGGIRREVFDGPYVDQTQLLIGIAWRTRRTVRAASSTFTTSAGSVCLHAWPSLAPTARGLPRWPLRHA